MSWDVFVQDLPDGLSTVQDIPEDFSPAPLGRTEELMKRIRSVVPDIDFSDERDPGWGRIDREGFSIEVSVGEPGELVTCIALFTRGGDAAAATVSALVAAFGGKALDTGSENGLYSAERAVDSLRSWRRYRDQVIPPAAPGGEGDH